MIGFDAEAVHREFGLAEDEVTVMLLSVGPERPGTGPVDFLIYVFVCNPRMYL
jgi:hypothetical protein